MAQSNVPTNVGSVLGGLAGTAIGGPVGGIAGQALGSVAGGLISAAPSIIKTGEEKYNEERLKELRRRQGLNLLGLTEEEKQQIYAQQDAAAQKAQQDIKDLQSGLASSLATGAGSAARNFAAEQEAMVRARAQAEKNVMEEQLKKKKEDLAEIEKRTSLKSEYGQNRLAALGGVAMTGIGALDESIARVQSIRGAKPTTEQIQQFMKYTGLNEQQTGEILGRIARDPAAASIYGSIIGTPTPTTPPVTGGTK